MFKEYENLRFAFRAAQWRVTKIYHDMQKAYGVSFPKLFSKNNFKVDDPVVVTGQYSIQDRQGVVEKIVGDKCLVLIDLGDYFNRELLPAKALRNNADRFFDVERRVRETDFSLNNILK